MPAVTTGDQAELKPSPTVRTTGLWSVDDGAYPDAAGTYAVVVGASKYKHFKDGEQPAAKTFGLGQLYSSAYSAYQFFDWLKTSFRITGSPVRKVWLLLSPTADESKLIGDQDYAAAEYPVIAQAIRDWFNALAPIPRNAALKSRCLFFFSGHGIEINTDKQVLLPADYLSTSPPMLTEAISTYNLYLGMGTLPIPVQCFLIDACRSDAEALRQQNGFDGAKILLEPFGGQNPRRNAPIVYATASGTSTYQSRVPEEMSFFAGGLLDGLRLKARKELNALVPEMLPGGLSGIKLTPLCEFVNAAMNGSLVAAGFPPDDPITIGGTQKATPIVVSEVRAASGGGGGGTGTQWTPPGSGVLSMGTGDGGDDTGDDRDDTSGGTAGPAPGKAERFAQVQPVLGGDNYGHESATAFFGSAELTEYDGLTWSSYAHRFTDFITGIDGLDRDYRRIRFVQPDRSKWYWLRCENQWIEYGFLFPPTDREANPVELAIESVVSEGRIDARAVISPQNIGFVAKAGELWRSYSGLASANAVRDVFAFTAATPGDVDGAIDVLYNKWNSPLSATIGSMILLRGGGDDDTAQWQRNLASAVAYTSDAAIFVLQRMIQTGTFDAAVAQRCVSNIEALGLPFTSEAFGYIVNLSDALRQQPDIHDDGTTFERMAEFNAFTRPGSLFLAVAATAASAAKGTLRDRLLGMGAVQTA